MSDSIAQPRATTTPEAPATAPEDRQITVMPLGQTRRDAVGLLPRQLTGLPADTIAGSDPARLKALFAQQPVDALPAMQGVVLMLLLAEMEPPQAAINPDALFFARIDTLLRFGALDQAQALMERAGATDQAAFRRWFDISLLTGFDTRACAAMTANPGIAPTLQARIFCLSRTGDWAAAALTLDTGRAIGAISEEEDRLLAHFLDPELFEGEPPPIPPRPMTPLAFRLLDGVGETPGTLDLPLAFAVSDLRPSIGWKAQIEAAERLTRVQALDPNRLLSLYTEQRPSASGGVWERARAVQTLDAALLSGQSQAVANALPSAVARMKAAGLMVPFARFYGARLAQIELPGTAANLALRVGLLSPDYENVARRARQSDMALQARDAFAIAVALGDYGAAHGGDPLHQAIADGLTTDAPAPLLRLAQDGRLGEALLEAALLLKGGAASDPEDIVDALALLKAAGLVDVARRAALQMLLT
ncbi:MAG: hypothetical protein AAFY65_00170 [Pseudomonadota bacterium]